MRCLGIDEFQLNPNPNNKSVILCERESMGFFFAILILFGCIAAIHIHPSHVQACQICVPYPEETLADRLLANDEIIFAREVPDTPYIFYQMEAIKGAGVTEPFKMFCDSSTRRKLQVSPDSAVVLTRKQNDSWQRMTFAAPGVQSFIRNLVSTSKDWPEIPNNQARLKFFSKLLHSEDPKIQEQAYMEVGRAPYSTIKDLAKTVSRKQIYDLLLNFRLIEWHSLYILMLGQKGEADDLKYIRDKLQSAAQFGSTLNLSAWVTAFIESHPEDGIEEVERMYFISQNRTNEELIQVITSMSLLGSQTNPPDLISFKLRSRIVQSYAKLLESYPEMAGYVSRDLSAWRIQAYVDKISEIREHQKILDESSTYLIDYYLSVASRFRRIRFSRNSDPSLKKGPDIIK